MATTGAKAPAAASSTSETGWAGNAWLTPQNLYGAGDAAITAATFDAGVHSQVLRAYTFDFSAIPDGSTINGVQVVINARYATAICALSLAQLLDTSRAKVGTNQYATPVNLTTSAANYTKGGATDKWGNALDAAWVKDPDFGVALGIIVGASDNCDVFIDSVTMEVWYTAAPNAYTLACAQGSFGLTGQTLTMTRALLMAETQGSYALSGQPLTLAHGYVMALTQGSYALTGQAMSFLRGLKAVLAQGSYSLTGQAVGLLRGLVLSVAQGSYVLTGQVMGFVRGFMLLLAQVGYTLTGQDITLIYTPTGDGPTLVKFMALPSIPTIPTVGGSHV